MRTPSQDTLKLGTTVALLGAVVLVGCLGLATVMARSTAERGPGFWADISVMAAGTLIVTAIVAFLVWVMVDQPPARSSQQFDA
jgi:hypothetical protein